LGSQHPEDAICEWDCTRFFDTDVIEEDLGIVGVVLCRESGPGPPRLWCEGRELSEWVLLIEEEESAPPVFQVVGDLLGRKSVAEESLRMFDEGRRRKLRGEDVVVASIQPDPSAEVRVLLDGFEVIPHSTALGASVIDVPAVLRRRPAVCLIDGLAYDNPPGSAHPQRWQDVEDLLAAGISVITSINLQSSRNARNRWSAF